MSGPRTYTVKEDDDGARVDRWFKRNMPEVPHALVSRWTRTGALRVDGAKVETGTRLNTGQQISVPASEPATAQRPVRARRPVTPEEAELMQGMVIHRDRAAIVLNKPPGLATQGGSGTTQHVDGMLDALADNDMGRPKLVHRLDKDTSGVLLVARSANAAARFSKSFSGRTARKIYWALVVGVPSIEQGEIDLPIGKQPGTGGEKMYVDSVEGQRAVSRYRVIDMAGNAASWVELQPLTGRTHQLRVHMAAIGHPIVGDGKYGGKAAFLTGAVSRKMHLHARRLRIDHPDGGRIDVTADLPHHFAESLDALGFDLLAAEHYDPVEDAEPRRPDAKTLAKRHAKDVRRERKGERRARGASTAATGKAKSGKSAKPTAAKKTGGTVGAATAKRVAPRVKSAAKLGAKLGPGKSDPRGKSGRPASSGAARKPSGGRPRAR